MTAEHESQLTLRQQRLVLVLERMIEQVKSDDEEWATLYVHSLEEMLCELNHDDCFGADGQFDPRGDFRNGEWSLHRRIEGIDAKTGFGIPSTSIEQALREPRK